MTWPDVQPVEFEEFKFVLPTEPKDSSGGGLIGTVPCLAGSKLNLPNKETEERTRWLLAGFNGSRLTGGCFRPFLPS